MIRAMTRRSFRLRAAGLAVALLAAVAPAAAQEETQTESQKQMAAARASLPADAARVLFSNDPTPAPLAARSIGAYARGCLAGAVAMPVDGEAWQVMRLSRNRNWGHPNLIAFLERFAGAARKEGWNGLLVGDLSQPRGGPMLTGHASHQVGLDADIWFTPMPSRSLTRAERETMSAVSMLKGESLEIDPARFSEVHARIVRRASLDREVARVFVHPGIKKALCEWADTGRAGPDRGWLRKVRPIYGHHFHFHVRIACPPGSEGGCKDQEVPPDGDGCGQELAWWLGPEPWKPSPPTPPKPPLKMADLPDDCRRVLMAR